MRMWVYNPHTGGKRIPPAVKSRTARRILNYAAKHYAGKFARIEIDGYSGPDLPRGRRPPAGETREQWTERLRNAPLHLCRIRYFGNEDRWSFAWYTYAHEKYEPSFLNQRR
ncbi:MAG TPA: hypothetical protein VMH81_37595 [Bryobacteraceae bacterium]|nr:hypothetical protein [Bryobacteraceae bacterium]